MLLNKEQRAKRGDEQGRSWEGRELTLGTWRSRGGAGPAEEVQEQRGTPRGLAGEEIGGAGEEKMGSRGGAGPAGRSPGDEDRRQGRPKPTRGRVNDAALPSIPPAPSFCGRARAWPRGKSSRSPIWRAKLAALALAPASAPPSAPPRLLAPPSAWKRDYGHSRGDGLRLAPNRRLVNA
jgi:hypothetical protein